MRRLVLMAVLALSGCGGVAVECNGLRYVVCECVDACEVMPNSEEIHIVSSHKCPVRCWSPEDW